MKRIERLLEKIDQALERRPADYAKAARLLEEVIDHAIDDPDGMELDLASLLLKLSYCYAGAGEADQAVNEWKAAIAAGLELDDSFIPAGIVESLLRHGHTVEAEVVINDLVTLVPDNDWLYLDIGTAYEGAGDNERALEWYSRGLERALNLNDETGALFDLFDCRKEVLEKLGREPDELQVRADQFIEAEYPSPEASADDGFEDGSREDDDCEDEGDDGLAADDFEDDFEDDDFGRVRFLDDYRDNDYLGQPLSVPIVRWFPREEFAAALELWPLFKQKWGESGYEGYCLAIQSALLYQAARTGRNPLLVPLKVRAFVDWCNEMDDEPQSPRAQEDYASELAKEGHGIPWPPGRNDPCWCGSGRKYKKCCGKVSSISEFKSRRQ